MTARPSILVFGAGAVGCYLGSKLAAAGASVTLIARPRIVDAIETRGLTVREDGIDTISRLPARPSAEALDPADLIILAVRAYDVAPAIPQLRSLLRDQSLLVALQNGVGSEELLGQQVGRRRALAGSLTVSVGMEAPGVVTRYSRSGGLALATLDGSRVPPSVVGAFAATDLPAVTIPDYRSLRWSKLLLNMLGAATTAILDVDMRTVMENPGLFRIEQLALREAGRVMDAQGIPTVELPGYPTPLVRTAMRLPGPLARALLGRRIAAARGGRAPTMRADVARGRSEIDYLDGAVAQAADRLQVRAPVNHALAELTRQVTAQPELRAAFAGRPELLITRVAEQGVRL